jgi:hypothetical protein
MVPQNHRRREHCVVREGGRRFKGECMVMVIGGVEGWRGTHQHDAETGELEVGATLPRFPKATAADGTEEKGGVGGRRGKGEYKV